MFSKSTLFLLKYYDIWGFWTEYFKSSVWKYFLFSLYTFHVIVVAISTFFIVYLTLVPHHFPGWFILNEIIKHYGISVTYWSILIDSYFHRDRQRQFWKLLDRIHSNNPHKISFQMYLLKFIKHFVANVFIEVLLISHFYSESTMFLAFITVRVIFLELYQSRLFHYLLYLEIIKSKIQILEKDVENLWKMNQISYFCKGRKLKFPIGMGFFDKIRQIREQYQLIFDVVNCVNGIFGWSNVFTILLAFHNAFTSMNWAFQTFPEFSWLGTGLDYFYFRIFATVIDYLLSFSIQTVDGHFNIDRILCFSMRMRLLFVGMCIMQAECNRK